MRSGSAEVSVSGLECGQEVEKWHPITLVGTKGTGAEGPSMRLKLKYQVRCTIYGISTHACVLSSWSDAVLLMFYLINL